MPACGWEITECGECTALTDLDNEIQEEVAAWAVNRLWEWTRQRFGPCEVTMHQDDEGVCCGLGHELSGCYCRGRTELVLPGPVVEVSLILLDGVELGLENVHVDDWSILVRDDGGTFPADDWEITYVRGEPVPPGGGLVAGLLACEYAKSLCRDSSCRLPRRVTSITREGMTIAMIDDFKSLGTDGFTGIWEIDDWIAAQNKPTRKSLVSSPDVKRVRQTTWSYEAS